MDEIDRLRFISIRDGRQAAINFAERTLSIYRAAVLHSNKRGHPRPHHASLPEYRRGFIESYCAIKKFRSNARNNP